MWRFSRSSESVSNWFELKVNDLFSVLHILSRSSNHCQNRYLKFLLRSFTCWVTLMIFDYIPWTSIWRVNGGWFVTTEIWLHFRGLLFDWRSWGFWNSMNLSSNPFHRLSHITFHRFPVLRKVFFCFHDRVMISKWVNGKWEMVNDVSHVCHSPGMHHSNTFHFVDMKTMFCREIWDAQSHRSLSHTWQEHCIDAAQIHDSSTSSMQHRVTLIQDPSRDTIVDRWLEVQSFAGNQELRSKHDRKDSSRIKIPSHCHAVNLSNTSPKYEDCTRTEIPAKSPNWEAVKPKDIRGYVRREVWHRSWRDSRNVLNYDSLLLTW
jgi:hypothetical protein